MGLCQYVYLCFHALSLPCSHTFWHAIPTSFHIFNVFKSCFCTFLMLTSVTVTPKPKKNISFKCNYMQSQNLKQHCQFIGCSKHVITLPAKICWRPTSPELRTKLFETNLLNFNHMTTDQLKPAQKTILTTDHDSITVYYSCE